jgi:hypothetical protein
LIPITGPSPSVGAQISLMNPSAAHFPANGSNGGILPARGVSAAWTETLNRMVAKKSRLTT